MLALRRQLLARRCEVSGELMGWQQRHSRGLTVNWELAQYLQDAHADWAIFQERFAPGELAQPRLRSDISEISCISPGRPSEAPAKLSLIGPMPSVRMEVVRGSSSLGMDHKPAGAIKFDREGPQ